MDNELLRLRWRGQCSPTNDSAGAVTDEYEYDAFGNSFTKQGQHRTTTYIAESNMTPISASTISAPDTTTQTPVGSFPETQKMGSSLPRVAA